MKLRTVALAISMSLVALADASVNQQLSEAKQGIQNDDPAAASGTLRRASQYLDREAHHLEGDAREGVSDSAKELAKLAGDVEKGTVRTADELAAPFARACRAAAESHFARATESTTRRSFRVAGHELRKAADDLEAAFVWSGKGVDHAGLAAVHDARVTGEHMERGVQRSAKAIDESIHAFGRELHSTASRIARI